MKTVLHRIFAILSAASLSTGLASPAVAADQPAPIDYMTAPFSMTRILTWGTRPDWSSDGKRIAFTASDVRPSPAFEIDLDTKAVRCLTCHLGVKGLIVRVYYLPDGNYLFLAPRNYDVTSNNTGVEELFWASATSSSPLQLRALGASAFGEIGISRPSDADGSVNLAWGDFQGQSRLNVGTLVTTGKGASLINQKVIYRLPLGPTLNFTEAYGFARNGKGVTFYSPTVEQDGTRNGEMLEVDVATGKLSHIFKDPHHNEIHLFADERYGLEESNRASDPSGPLRGVSGHDRTTLIGMKIAGFGEAEIDNYAPTGGPKGPYRPFDIFVIKRDGSAAPRRLTSFSDKGIGAHQSVISTDGRRVAFVVEPQGNNDPAGEYGLYIGDFSPSLPGSPSSQDRK